MQESMVGERRAQHGEEVLFLSDVVTQVLYAHFTAHTILDGSMCHRTGHNTVQNA